MHHMIIALRPEPFVDSLCKKPTTNIDELRQLATKFMQMEKLREFQNQVRVDRGSEKKTNEKELGYQYRNLVVENFNNIHH